MDPLPIHPDGRLISSEEPTGSTGIQKNIFPVAHKQSAAADLRDYRYDLLLDPLLGWGLFEEYARVMKSQGAKKGSNVAAHQGFLIEVQQH